MLAYAVLLSAAVALSGMAWSAHPGSAVLRCAVAVLANWFLGMIVSALGWTDAWPVNIALDTATAMAVLWHPAGRWQAVLGVSYCAQIAMHIGYGVRMVFMQGADPTEYYNWLTVVAFVQLLILGSWSIGDILGGGIARRGGRDTAAVEARDTGMAEP